MLLEYRMNQFCDFKGCIFADINDLILVNYFPGIAAKTYKNIEIGQQAVAQIPWGHNIVIMQKVSNEQERIWYAQETIRNGCSIINKQTKKRTTRYMMHPFLKYILEKKLKIK